MCSCGKSQRQLPTPPANPPTAGTVQVSTQDNNTTIRQTLTREEFRRINFERKQIKPPPTP